MNFLLILSFLAGLINIIVFYEDVSFFASSAILMIIPTMVFICYKKIKTIEAKIDASNSQKDKKE
ncbi:MAG: hypothetical protein IJZ16_11655 [Clostridia bacterium]|nr:hypothetical protein [Clostridia bacterium]